MLLLQARQLIRASYDDWSWPKSSNWFHTSKCYNKVHLSYNIILLLLINLAYIATAHVIAVPTPVDVVNARFLNICLDPRLSYWSPAIPVNEKRHSVVSKQLKHAYTGCVMNRIICKLKGFTVPAKAAHIVANNSSINYAFFNYPKYADDLDPHCIRNYIPLCGTSGEADSCHNEFDQFLLTFIYNPMQQNFQIASLRPGWRHYDLNGASITFSHQPYRRLLAWRSRHS